MLFSMGTPGLRGPAAFPGRSGAEMNLHKILVVEDSWLLHHLYDLVLLRYSSHGVQVLHAFNGAEALRVLGDHPDTGLILLDLVMPVMDGLQFLRARQERDSLWSIPVLVVTTHGQEKEVALAIEAGACGVLTKPLDPDALHAELQRLFGFMDPI